VKKNPSSKIVLTGGPCAGKSTLAEMLSRAFPNSLMNVPEAASLLFSGGFPRFTSAESRKATQRAIYGVQTELENSFAAQFPAFALVLDRGTIDGAAYWPDGPEAFFAAMGTSFEAELGRYDHVIYLESAAKKDYETHRAANPNRNEDWEEARRLDRKTFKLWSRHPSFIMIRNQRSFAHKVSEVLGVVAGSIQGKASNEQE
jgi:hypothetical protein